MTKLISVEDHRRLTRRRLPRIVFDYLEGGALDEVTLRRNLADLQEVRLQQRIRCDVSDVSLERTLLGTRVQTPVLISPMGLLSLFHRDADIAMARAAHARGTIFIHSAWSGTPLREVAAVAPGSVWAQLSMWKDARLTEEHIERAEAADIPVLVLAGDVSVSSKRERDLHNGFGMTAVPTVRGALNAARKPRWLSNLLFGPKISFGDQSIGNKALSLRQMHQFMEQSENQAVTWQDVERLRKRWSGKLIVKGVMSGHDATRARDAGVDAVFVSNHGGRQFDAQPSTTHALEEVAAAVGGDLEILVDGGIRRGSDIVKLAALGANGCLIGRPAVYGLVSNGQAGVCSVLDILAEEAATALAFTGATRLDQVGHGAIATTGIDHRGELASECGLSLG
jgi:isopentenyl diphosphate isomerase/L-lactate dehydrogenase-like FMN-dependent dehydrogenase